MLKYKKCQDRWDRAVEQLGYRSVEEMMRDLTQTRTYVQVSHLIGFTPMSICNMMKRLKLKSKNLPVHKQLKK